jgi:nucleoredoxin
MCVCITRAPPRCSVYFSAHWCGPCRGFTPKLAAFYRAQAAAGAPFEVIFVSSDKSQGEFDGYLHEMPWRAVPWAMSDVRSALSALFGVRGIPHFALIKRDGSIAVPDARGRVEGDPAGFPWGPKPVESLTVALDSINDEPWVVLFTDKLTDGDVDTRVCGAYDEVAAAAFAAGGAGPRFAVAGDKERNAQKVRDFVGLGRDPEGDDSVRLVVLNIPGGVKHVWAGRVPTADDIRGFVAAFVAGTAPSVGLRA